MNPPIKGPIQSAVDSEKGRAKLTNRGSLPRIRECLTEQESNINLQQPAQTTLWSTLNHVSL